MRQLVWSPALIARPGAGLLGRPLCAGAAASTDGRRQSRSAVSGALLVQPWTRTSTGQRSFAAYGLRTWDRLPTALRSPELSLASYKRQLKTPCSSTRQCWLQLLVSCTVVRRCCDCTVSSAPTINVQTDLISADGGSSNEAAVRPSVFSIPITQKRIGLRVFVLERINCNVLH